MSVSVECTPVGGSEVCVYMYVCVCGMGVRQIEGSNFSRHWDRG
jgi:hypothetical protein